MKGIRKPRLRVFVCLGSEPLKRRGRESARSKEGVLISRSVTTFHALTIYSPCQGIPGAYNSRHHVSRNGYRFLAAGSPGKRCNRKKLAEPYRERTGNGSSRKTRTSEIDSGRTGTAQNGDGAGWAIHRPVYPCGRSDSRNRQREGASLKSGAIAYRGRFPKLARWRFRVVGRLSAIFYLTPKLIFERIFEEKRPSS
jgi:hypothetical protein